MELILCWPRALGPGPALDGWYTQWHSVWINWFPLAQQISTVNSFLVGVALCICFPFSVLRFWNLCRMCALSVCELICPAVSGRCCFLGPIHTLALTLFPPSLPHGSLSLEEAGLIKRSHLRSCPSCSLDIVQLCLCVKYNLLQENASLVNDAPAWAQA